MKLFGYKNKCSHITTQLIFHFFSESVNAHNLLDLDVVWHCRYANKAMLNS